MAIVNVESISKHGFKEWERLFVSATTRIAVSRRCLCDVNGDCYNVNGMCVQERVLLCRSPRKVSPTFTISVVPQEVLQTIQKEFVVELLPVIPEEELKLSSGF